MTCNQCCNTLLIVIYLQTIKALFYFLSVIFSSKTEAVTICPCSVSLSVTQGLKCTTSLLGYVPNKLNILVNKKDSNI
jgi:hypothetical protein